MPDDARPDVAIVRVDLGDRRSLAISGAGFVLLLVASCSIEALRFYKLKALLPLAPGGVVGSLVGNGLQSAIGFTGATLLLLTLLVIGLSLFVQVSLIAAIERLGGWLEDAWVFAVERIGAWRDRKVGAVAAVEREVSVEEVRKRLDVHERVHIEPAVTTIPTSSGPPERARSSAYSPCQLSREPSLHRMIGLWGPTGSVSASRSEPASNVPLQATRHGRTPAARSLSTTVRRVLGRCLTA